ncbi:hypothetical protein HK096_001792, partial [Nowakowskiella sp. JEL0078]
MLAGFEDAFDDSGNLIVEKSKAINKIGHGLHQLESIFRDITICEKTRDIARSLNFK